MNTEPPSQAPRNFGKLPLGIVLRIVFEGYRSRKMRSGITLLGIALATAFLALVWIGPVAEGATREDAALRVWMIAMSLLVCTMGIANSVLMSVTDRFREIGTMKCLGASDRLIKRMFLIESMLFGFCGGLLGSFLGLVAARASADAPVGDAVAGKIVAIVLISCGLSIVATVIPASVAARMTPMDAMRPLK